MNEHEPIPMKAHLYNFVMSFSMGVLLLDQLPMNKRVKRAMAVCIATSDEIKTRLETADDTMQAAMIITSRKHLRQVRDVLLEYPMVTNAAKAKTEWVANSKQLLKATEGVGAS